MIDNNYSFVFTADYEEPSCAWCDFQDTCDGRKVKCGPTYGWSKYRRTIQLGYATPMEEDIIRLVESREGKVNNG